VTVRWASALPVKQAIVRSRYQGDFEESDRDKQLLNSAGVLLIELPGSSLTHRMKLRTPMQSKNFNLF
jgi:hypothetical protein